jgi:hypothetical protein
MPEERAKISDNFSATVIRGAGESENSKLKGVYTVKCFRKSGFFGRKKLVWEDTIENIITDVGANFALNQTFGAAQNTTYFLGLISSIGYTGVPAVGDTMTLASHNSRWLEAGNGVNYPNWSTPASNARVAITWNAAAARAKSLAAVATFIIATNGGTLKGGFIVTGTGAVATNNDVNGTLFSAGLFSAGDKVVQIADTLQVSYTVTLS